MTSASPAWLFFDRPDYDLASAVPGSFAITPIPQMVVAIARDYENTKAMISALHRASRTS